MKAVKWSLAFSYLIQEIVGLQCPRTNSSTATCPRSCCEYSVCCDGECCDTLCCAEEEVKNLMMRYHYIFPIFVFVCAVVVILCNFRGVFRKSGTRVRPKVPKPTRIMVRERSNQENQSVSVSSVNNDSDIYSTAEKPGSRPTSVQPPRRYSHHQ